MPWSIQRCGELAPFWALRLYDIGAIKGSPQRIIQQGTDLRFLNELKRELKV